MAAVAERTIDELGPVLPGLVWSGPDLEAHYERETARLRAEGERLSGPEGQTLAATEWERAFEAYRRDLAGLRSLGDQLRPISLRERARPMSGDELVTEVLELFA